VKLIINLNNNFEGIFKVINLVNDKHCQQRHSYPEV